MKFFITIFITTLFLIGCYHEEPPIFEELPKNYLTVEYHLTVEEGDTLTQEIGIHGNSTNGIFNLYSIVDPIVYQDVYFFGLFTDNNTKFELSVILEMNVNVNDLVLIIDGLKDNGDLINVASILPISITPTGSNWIYTYEYFDNFSWRN